MSVSPSTLQLTAMATITAPVVASCWPLLPTSSWQVDARLVGTAAGMIHSLWKAEQRLRVVATLDLAETTEILRVIAQ